MYMYSRWREKRWLFSCRM